MTYVKICPRCGAENEELAEVCSTDGEFLGMVPATPSRGPKPLPALDCVSDVRPKVESRVEVSALLPETPILYLDCEAGGQCHAVRSGWTVGQMHESSTAEAQLANVPGIQYVHRQHCRFDYDGGAWYISPLPQTEYTNPTLVNGRRIAVGERMTVKNGDRLALAGVRLTVRMLEK